MSIPLFSGEYDALNRIRKAFYPNDRDNTRKVMKPTYNKGGALLSLKVDTTDYVREVAYNARGQRILIAYGNKIMTRYAYDPKTFRVLRQRSALFNHSGHTYTPNAGIRQDMQYTYDLEGTITSMNDAAPANTYAQGPGNLLRLFTHDPLRRLLSATGREISNVYSQPSWDLNIRPMDYTDTNTYIRTYRYDKIGNIQNLNHSANGHANQDFNRDYSYDSSDNKLKSFTVNSTTYGNSYDPNGNLTKEGQSRYYEWGANDKLAVFKNKAGTSTPSVYTNYFYNAQGDRIKKHTRKGNKIVVTFYMDGGMFETSYTKTVGGGIDNNRFYNTIKISDDGALIATIRVGNNVDDGTFAIKYIVGDYLNNSTAVLKTTGSLINREEYYPFGETSFGGFQYKRYRYNGKEKDEESGLYEYGQRYYAPWLCRFVSVDPLAHEFPWQSPYNGFNDNPINLIDPDGRAAMPPDDYSVDKNGNLKLEQKTDDNFDMLYTKSDYDQGNTQNGLKINDQSILPSLKEGNYGTAKATVSERSTDDLYATFMFLANKTSSEWAVYQTNTNNEKQFTLGTLHEKGFSPSPTNLSLNKDDVLSMVHSHPGADLSTEMSSMGYWQSNNQLQARGDWYIVRNKLQEGQKQSYFYYTYFPKSGNLYHVEKSTPRYIRNIQNNPKRFFFGTMR